MSLILQKRDIEILKRTYAFRVMTYQQIRRHHFDGNERSVARRRIGRLCQAGLLKPVFVPSGRGAVKSVICAEKAWSAISNLWSFEIDSPLFRSESLNHDIRLSEVGFRFERLKSFCSLMTENLLQSSSSLAGDPLYRDLVTLQADGALLLRGPDKRSYLYGVELEISKKTVDRYKEKLSSYYRASGVDGVLYICSDSEIMNLLARIDRAVCTEKESIVYLALEASVLNAQEKIYFRSSSGKRIGLY